MRRKEKVRKTSRQYGWWAKISLLCLKYWPLVILGWLAVLGSCAYIYTQLIAKEGFPDISEPIILVSANYLSDDAEENDRLIAQPLHKIISDDVQNIRYSQTTSTSHGVNGFVYLTGEVEAEDGQRAIREALEAGRDKLPADLEVKVEVLGVARYLGAYDMLLTVFDRSQQSDLIQTQAAAQFVADELKAIPELQDARVIELIISDSRNDQQRQIGFNQIGLGDGGGELDFYQAIHVGIVRDEQAVDTLRLKSLMERELADLNLDQLEGEFETLIIEDLAKAVERNINSLENNLLTGLIVISLVSLLLISWRSAIVVALFMLSVLATAVLILFTLGYSLNIITLFALILALGLLVDDAVIMVEALDVVKSRDLSQIQIVRRALDKILLASLAGTLTTVLVFIPLIFVEGILGEFIRFIPVTLMLTLLLSFLFSITLIPVLAKFSILKEKPGSFWRRNNPFLKLENWLARVLASIPLQLKRKPRLGRTLMSLILLGGLGFIFYSFALFAKINVNIFPPLDDSDTLTYAADLPAGYDLAQAEEAAGDINAVLNETLGGKIERVNYLVRSISNERRLEASVLLKDISERKILSPLLVDDLQQAFNDKLDPELRIFVRQEDVGPPARQYPLSMPVLADDLEQAERLTEEIAAYLTDTDGPELELPNGEVVAFKKTRIQPGEGQSLRFNGQRIIYLEAQYDRLYVSDQILNDSKALIKQNFDEKYLKSNGYDTDLLEVETPESSFEESFKSLIYIFPLAILLVYLLLCWQFRSWLQPLIILVALPFAMAGVLNWLYVSQNAFSFNIGIGLVALLGIAINNTILLTAYANTARGEGLTPVEAISRAVRERFRPLIMTTLTTTLALLPLALNDVFWRNLALTIIWGLVGSTVLVLFIFPYCYLGVVNLANKWRRQKSAKKQSSWTLMFLVFGGGCAITILPLLFGYVVYAIQLLLALELFREAKISKDIHKKAVGYILAVLMLLLGLAVIYLAFF